MKHLSQKVKFAKDTTNENTRFQYTLVMLCIIINMSKSSQVNIKVLLCRNRKSISNIYLKIQKALTKKLGTLHNTKKVTSTVLEKIDS